MRNKEPTPFSKSEIDQMADYLGFIRDNLKNQSVEFHSRNLWHIYDGFQEEIRQLECLIDRLAEHLPVRQNKNMENLFWILCETCKHEFYSTSPEAECDWCHGTDIVVLSKETLIPSGIDFLIAKIQDINMENKETFRIYGQYQGRAELIDEFETEKEARRCLSEYRMAYGPGWLLWIVDPLSIKLMALMD